jgi:hypothetical protein
MRWVLAPLNALLFLTFILGGISCLAWLPHAWAARLDEPEDLWAIAIIGSMCILSAPVALLNTLYQFDWQSKRPSRVGNSLLAAAFAPIGIAGMFETGVTAPEMIAMFVPAAVFIASSVCVRKVADDAPQAADEN